MFLQECFCSNVLTVMFLQECFCRNVFAGMFLQECFCRRSEEHTSELQSQSNVVCRLLLEKKNKRRFGTRRQSPDSGGANPQYRHVITHQTPVPAFCSGIELARSLRTPIRSAAAACTPPTS